jgi:hypothetical protein
MKALEGPAAGPKLAQAHEDLVEGGHVHEQDFDPGKVVIIQAQRRGPVSMVHDPRVPGETQIEQRGAHTSQGTGTPGTEGRHHDSSVPGSWRNVKHWNRLSFRQMKPNPVGGEGRANEKPLQPSQTLPRAYLPEERMRCQRRLNGPSCALLVLSHDTLTRCCHALGVPPRGTPPAAVKFSNRVCYCGTTRPGFRKSVACRLPRSRLPTPRLPSAPFGTIFPLFRPQPGAARHLRLLRFGKEGVVNN